MIGPQDVSLLRCPDCRAPLNADTPARAGLLRSGALICRGCAARWPLVDGLPRLLVEQAVQGPDRLMRSLYDVSAPLHDWACDVLLPLVQGQSCEALRDGYMPRLELGALRPHADGTPVRLLEVGIGAGANLALLRRDLPAGLEVEIWGPDLSEGMLGQCRRRVRRGDERDVRLLLADAHTLPFADGSFDRVFHVGGIGGFRDPARALSEMARVARPGTPVVVVDEQLEPGRRHGLWHRAGFALLTFYDPAPHCPRECLPPGSWDVLEEQVSRFYYSLRYRVAGR